MTTRAELRTSLRQRLEDTGASPLWDDATLNDALAGALRVYSGRLPMEATTQVAVVAVTQQIVVNGEIEPERIVRVIDPLGREIPRQPDEHREGRGWDLLEQAWRWWNGALRLERPALAGTWQIDYLTTRAAPADDLSPVAVLPGDEEIVLALAAASALRRRAIEDGKRGVRADAILALATSMRDEADRLMVARRRRARGGVLGGG